MTEIISGVSAEVIETLFGGAPLSPDSYWLGEIYRLDDGRDLMPFVFLTLRFITIFVRPIHEAGGEEEFLATQAAEWANGFVPDNSARIVKFFRADAENGKTLFKPDEWKLDKPRHIFAFSELLANVMVQHAGVTPPVQQYFFWPASVSVDRLYVRTFRVVSRLLPGVFRPILQNIGDFRGYQRSNP